MTNKQNELPSPNDELQVNQDAEVKALKAMLTAETTKHAELALSITKILDFDRTGFDFVHWETVSPYIGYIVRENQMFRELFQAILENEALANMREIFSSIEQVLLEADEAQEKVQEKTGE